MPELGQRVWDESDDVLWHTCALVSDTARDRPPRGPAVTAPFAPYLGAGESLLASAPFTRYEHRPGEVDGHRRRGLFLATGAVGLTLTAAVAAGQLVGEVRRRRAARRSAATPWVPVDRGTLTVSTHGFYLETAAGLFDWPWRAVLSAEVVTRGHVVIAGRTAHGPVRWVLSCPWAELLFALWAMREHPSHPQLRTGDWLPEGWWDWATRQRGGPPPALPN